MHRFFMINMLSWCLITRSGKAMSIFSHLDNFYQHAFSQNAQFPFNHFLKRILEQIKVLVRKIDILGQENRQQKTFVKLDSRLSTNQHLIGVIDPGKSLQLACTPLQYNYTCSSTRSFIFKSPANHECVSDSFSRR